MILQHTPSLGKMGIKGTVSSNQEGFGQTPKFESVLTMVSLGDGLSILSRVFFTMAFILEEGRGGCNYWTMNKYGT